MIEKTIMFLTLVVNTISAYFSKKSVEQNSHLINGETLDLNRRRSRIKCHLKVLNRIEIDFEQSRSEHKKSNYVLLYIIAILGLIITGIIIVL